VVAFSLWRASEGQDLQDLNQNGKPLDISA